MIRVILGAFVTASILGAGWIAHAEGGPVVPVLFGMFFVAVISAALGFMVGEEKK